MQEEMRASNTGFKRASERAAFWGGWKKILNDDGRIEDGMFMFIEIPIRAEP